jgi:hypothetical protein
MRIRKMIMEFMSVKYFRVIPNVFHIFVCKTKIYTFMISTVDIFNGQPVFFVGSSKNDFSIPGSLRIVSLKVITHLCIRKNGICCIGRVLNRIRLFTINKYVKHLS